MQRFVSRLGSSLASKLYDSHDYRKNFKKLIFFIFVKIWDVTDAFEKIKCIFGIAPVGILEKSRECFLTEKHSLDAECGGTGRWPQSPVCLTLLGLSTGRTL